MQLSRYAMIFEAIRQLLEEGEVEQLTISNIAQRCHLHVNTVNYYFNGKADMMMRFHTYVTNVRTSDLPDSYYTVPQDTARAVKAFVEVVDLELFRVDYSSKAQRRLFLYLFGNMYTVPQIRYYLVEKQESYNAFVRQVFEKYAAAGIVDPARLDEGLISLMLVTSGYTFTNYYYDRLPPDVHLRHERRRLVYSLVAAAHHPLLDRLFAQGSGSGGA